MRPGLSPALLLIGLCLLAGAVVSILGVLASFGGDSIRGMAACAWRGHHDPARHPLGGFRCRDCGLAGAVLSDFGFEGTHYVTPPAVHEARARVRDTDRAPIPTSGGFYRPARRRS